MQINEIVIDLNGHQLLLRNAREEDAEALIAYLKTVAGETRFLAEEPEEITLTIEEECHFIHEQNANERNLMLLGFLDGELVGEGTFIGMRQKRFQHRINMGIDLYQKYTGMGIGTVMMEQMIRIAKENQIEQIDIEVLTTNQRAISLYLKMGFEIFGRLPYNMKYKDGSYADSYWMMRRLSV